MSNTCGFHGLCKSWLFNTIKTRGEDLSELGGTGQRLNNRTQHTPVWASLRNDSMNQHWERLAQDSRAQITELLSPQDSLIIVKKVPALLYLHLPADTSHSLQGTALCSLCSSTIKIAGAPSGKRWLGGGNRGCAAA